MAYPVLTLKQHAALVAARAAGTAQIAISLDMSRTETEVSVGPDDWGVGEQRYPYLEGCKENAVFFWTGKEFELASRFRESLIKLVPTDWGPPTFHIDGIKMLPTAKVCPFEDARRKVELIKPQGKEILDCCGGLGYFASWCLQGGAKRIQSYEINPDVVWLRGINPWSPAVGGALSLTPGDIGKLISTLPSASFDAALHDPPRFALAGDLYSQVFYDHLARVLRPGGMLFHYTGTPNMLTSGRNVPKEVQKRLVKAGFDAEIVGDGLLATKRAKQPKPAPRPPKFR